MRRTTGFAQLATLTAAIPVYTATGEVEAASNAEPIVITSEAHGLVTGDKVIVIGVEGNTNANGNWSVTLVDVDNFILDGSEGNDDYTTGGDWYKQPVANYLLLSAETQSVRWRDDGTDPTGSVGMILTAAGGVYLYDGPIHQLRVIEATSAAKLNVTFCRNM